MNHSTSGSSDSTGAYYPLEPPQDDGDSSNNKTKKSFIVEEEDTTSAAAVITTTPSIPGTEGDIALLSMINDYYSKTGRHPTSCSYDLHCFYKNWIQPNLPHVYPNKEALEIKINELHSRFLWNMRNDVDIPIGSINVNILQLSSYIWHNEVDPILEEETEDDDQDSQGSCDETFQISNNDTKDSLSKDTSSKGNEDGSSAS